MKRKLHALTALAFLITHCMVHGQDPENSFYERNQEIEKHIYSDTLTRNEAKKIFKEVKSKAETGNAEASCTLGILYKDGIGTSLNFNKARKQFKNAFELGSDKAAYSLGYMYLKGLGNIPQDYKKAIQWFRKSEYPMAKHWLAKCHYYGYGLSANKEKGMELLRENPIGNSKILLHKWEYEKETANFTPNDTSSPNNPVISDPTTSSENTFQSNSLSFSDGIAGVWKGEWHFMDWSSERVMRIVPITIEISENDSGMLDCSIELEGNEYIGNILENGNELIFPDMRVALSEKHVDHPSDLILDYQLTSLSFTLESKDGGQYLKGDLEANIINWSEPAPPSQLILRREGVALSQVTIDALSAQTEHFIKVYPNPFEQDLLLHYTLEQDSEVSIKLIDYYNPTKVFKAKVRVQKKGERIVTLDGLDTLKKGLYIVSMNVGANNYSRIVIRK